MAQFGLIRSFDIDDGQLDGLTPQQCFTLGYELCMIDSALKLPAGFSRPVNADNRERIEKACLKAGREFKLSWIPVDRSETWMQLEVAPKA